MLEKKEREIALHMVKVLEVSLMLLKRENRLKAEVDDVIEFVGEFAEVVKQNKAAKVRGPSIDVQTFERLREKYDLSVEDCTTVPAKVMLQRADFKDLGKRLLFSASSAGSESATIRIMNHAQLAQKDNPATLKSEELVDARKHLRAISNEGENYRAMVLDGKVAYVMGDHDHAIQTWERAMDAAVAASEEAKRFRAAGKLPPPDSMAGADLDDLSSPWIELQMVYQGRRDHTDARRVIDIGCEQDDPVSHYGAALFQKRYDRQRNYNGVRSGFLYYMTKAAASGYAKAMHELGVWYVSTAWPYISEEPPDEIKPTPFDRYPPDANTREEEETTLWQKTRLALGVDSPPGVDPTLHDFHTAAYPATLQQRCQMALQWLEIAQGFTYAPSFLVAAKILLEKYFWSDYSTPKAALELSEERYIYASKADYEASKPIQRKNQPAAEQNVLNPNYNPEKAKRLIREIFYAAIALDHQRERLHALAKPSERRKHERNSFDVEHLSTEEYMPQDMSPNIKKWFRYPSIREQYMNDGTGKMYDDVLQVDLLYDAKDICDEQGWNIYGEDGGLLYRHGLRRKAATPVAAAALAK